MKLLLSKGVDAREGDKEKNSPLMLSARYGRAENIEALINHLGEEIVVNRKNKEGNAALHFAA